MNAERLAHACATVGALVGDQAESWDRTGLVPESVLRELAGGGLLCPQVSADDGGLGFDSLPTGQYTQTRWQFGKVLAGHQLISRHLAELFAAEQVSTRICEHASGCWDAHSVDMVAATVAAKYVSARNAVSAAARAVQVLAPAGRGTAILSRGTYRDAKLMEIIEGSNEICQVMLAEGALSLT